MKKRAFTLTELLVVVVVIIATLSAVVLPKFTKVLETRKATKAESILQAVRAEQEARCTLDKNYKQTQRSWQPIRKTELRTIILSLAIPGW